MPALSTGKTAPTFQLATTTGGCLALPEALASGPVLLAFFKVSCPTCQFTFPFLERIYQQLREQGVQIWGVVQDKAPDARRFAATYGVTFPILIDDSPYEVSRAYGLAHVPSLFLVKADGRVEISSEGFSKADLLAIQKSLAQLLSATPPALFLPTEGIPEYKPG
ncbi:MAG TPA: TlpA disulfide reductase family protein [Terriglobia bacterium]|nr:TlpA disulfide reductase family protein [Terriglobia bacterium]